MALGHDPIRQASYLTQGLSQEKKPLALLLGAGCPVAITVGPEDKKSPLIPNIAGMTKIIRDELSVSKDKESFGKVLSHFTADGKPDPNIEEILSHVRGMRQVAGRESVRGLTAEVLDGLDVAICESIATLVSKDLPTLGTPYHQVATWVFATKREVPVEVFTTNYDLLMEQAFEEHRVPYFDGFLGSYKTFFDAHAIEQDKLPPRWARLWKIHGSVNWYQSPNGMVHRGQSSGKDSRRVIHPSHLKYDESRRMPYLAMRDRLRGFLRLPSACLVTSGYSFNDEHINSDIIDGIQGNPTSIVFALVFGALGDYSKAIQLAENRSNLNLLGKDEAVIGTRRSSWIERGGAEDLRESTAVGWVSVDDKKLESPKKAVFKLGDFASLGAFLGDLIGVDREGEHRAR